ncbi:Hsp90 cochaperone shq1 [Apophysomyces sp. BC1034]|nr:Hsp90 cochaperone shq1 [Apophysomyces sp. BC1015]KAG0182151.1 Hsp90 cochaperone shq1 [Apophysomyces sp. BC1021]KAG0192808.1 Hsp90 cochaperone shq1 [Apophysomyces sp. BC1034]
MITPSFKVDQDDASVTIVIKTPYVRAQDVDLHVQNNEFRLFLRPYFLRLYFPGNLVEDDDSKAVYDPSSGEFTVRISKETKGEHFVDLDLLTKLLARRGETGEKKEPKKPLIEVIGEQPAEEEELTEELQDAVDFNWELPQELPKDELMIQTSYGFNNQYSGYFTHVQETMNEIMDINDPEKSTVESRQRDRIEKENLKFDEDYYAMNFAHDDEVQHLMKYKPIWSKELRRIQKLAATNKEKVGQKAPLIEEVGEKNVDINMDSLSITDNEESLVKFSSKDESMMRDLPHKEYLLSNEKITYLGLVDILFAYSYNHRVFEGENTVESVWCIGKISPTIACLEQFTTLKDVVIASFRRALAYPLQRNFALCEKVLQDVYILFRLGKRAILKALLETKDLFDHHDVYYIYSKTWLDDYCVWIQHASDHVIRTLAHELHHFTVDKSEIGWDLEELENLAKEMKELEDAETNNLE